MLCPYSIMLRSFGCCCLYNKKDILIYLKYYTDERSFILRCYLNKSFLKDVISASRNKIY